MGTSWLFFLCISASLLSLVQFADGANLGVCYPRLGPVPRPASAVPLYQKYRIGRMRIYSPDPDILLALHNTTIQLVVGILNTDIPHLATSLFAADRWISANILPHLPFVSFRYIVVGENTLFPPSSTASLSLFAAMTNLFIALAERGLDSKIKVTTAMSQSALRFSYPPSTAMFYTGVHVEAIVKFLDMQEAPLFVNLYPYFAYVNSHRSFPLKYVLFESKSYGLVDNGHHYTNLFDAMVDAFYAALEKLGVPNLRVAVSETGWPTAGLQVADPSTAKIYTWNLIRHVLSTSGTPKKPGGQIETYIFSLYDLGKLAGCMRNFGLFYDNGKPVFGLPPVE